MNCESEYISIMEEIQNKESLFTELVDSKNYTKISELAAELAMLNEKAAQLRETIQQNNITENDVEKLRRIEPKRKSIQNMLNNEIAQTIKFEKLLKSEFGEKSAYEMRNGNLDWRSDVNKKIPIITVEKRDVSQIQKDKKTGLLKRGNYVNSDTGITINYGSAGIEDTLSHANFEAKRHIPIEAKLSALYQMQELIENSICFDSNISETGKNKTPNTLFMHKMYGVYRYDNEMYLAILSIEESYISDRNNVINDTNKRLYNLKEIKTASIRLELGDQSQGLLSNDNRAKPFDAIISIAQLYEIVKTYDPYYYENPNAIGRAEREAEIKQHSTYLQAVEEYEKVLPSLSENKEDYIKELDDIIHACEKIKEAIESGDIEINRKTSNIER